MAVGGDRRSYQHRRHRGWHTDALRRERIEELEGIEEVNTRFIGWINDDSDPVGQVHLGAVHLDEVQNPDSLRIREQGEDLHTQGWWSAGEIMSKAERFEKWSVLAVELCNQHLTQANDEHNK